MITSNHRGHTSRCIGDLIGTSVTTLVIRLIRRIARLPGVLIGTTGRRKLAVVKLHHHVPFISVYRDIGAVVIHSRVHVRVRISIVSASLHSRLTRTSGPGTITSNVTGLFNRSIIVFSISNLRITQTKRGVGATASYNVMLTLRRRGQPLNTLRVDRHGAIFSRTVYEEVRRVTTPILALCLSKKTHINVITRLVTKPRSNIRISSVRTHRNRTVLSTLKFTTSNICVPFTVGLGSITGTVPTVISVVSSFRSGNNYRSVYLLRNSLVVNFLTTRSDNNSISMFSSQYLRTLARITTGRCMCAIRKHTTLSAVSLVSTFNTLHDIVQAYVSGSTRYPCKAFRYISSSLLRHVLKVRHASRTIHVIVARAIKRRLVRGTVLVSALYTYFSGLSGGANTYRRLNVRQRALCGQLSGIARVINVTPASGVD